MRERVRQRERERQRDRDRERQRERERERDSPRHYQLPTHEGAEATVKKNVFFPLTTVTFLVKSRTPGPARISQ